MVQVREHIDATYAATVYGYDDLDNLVYSRDAANNVTNMTYNSLSQRTTLNDPDGGALRYWAASDTVVEYSWDRDLRC